MYQWCVGCREERNINDFAVSHTSLSGRQYFCQSCISTLSASNRASIHRVIIQPVIRNNERAARLHLPATLTFLQWYEILRYWDFSCAACKKKGKICLDHWISLSRSDTPGTVATNTLPLCVACNTIKDENDPARWIRGKYYPGRWSAKRSRKSIAVADEAMRRLYDYFEWVKSL